MTKPSIEESVGRVKRFLAALKARGNQGHIIQQWNGCPLHDFDLTALLEAVEAQRELLEYTTTFVALWASLKARETGVEGLEFHPHFHEKLEQLAPYVGGQERILEMIRADRKLPTPKEPQ